MPARQWDQRAGVYFPFRCKYGKINAKPFFKVDSLCKLYVNYWKNYVLSGND